VITAQEIFRFRRRGISNEGAVVGHFESTGVRPAFLDRLQMAGIEPPLDMFALR
jgi:pilus assembly protein CpaF